MVDDVRVRRASAQALDARIVQRWIAVYGKQPATGAILREPAIVAHEPALVVHAAVLDPEHADVAFTVERNIARMERVLRIRTDAIERAVQVARNLSLDVAMAHVGFELVRGRRAAHRHRDRVGRRSPARGPCVAVEHLCDRDPDLVCHSLAVSGSRLSLVVRSHVPVALSSSGASFGRAARRARCCAMSRSMSAKTALNSGSLRMEERFSS